MAKFIVEEIREITTRTQVNAKDASEAMFLYKHKKDKTFTFDVDEDSNITVKSEKEAI